MRTRFLSFCFLLISCFPTLAQLAEPLAFQEKIHDFGNIREGQGNADFDFTFTNNSGRTIRIISVQASCGCTTPGWTKEPIAPGKEGFVKASFNPVGRPGYFNKTLTVTTDLDNTPIVLQIKGQVLTQEMENDASRLSESLGKLNVRSSAINMGKVYVNRGVPPTEFKVRNNGTNPMRFVSVASPNYFMVTTPEELAPGTMGVVRVVLDAQAKNQYGFISESFEIITDDPELERKHFSVYATIEEYFAPLSEQEKKNAPVMKLEIAQIDLKQIKMNATAKRSIDIQNTGKQDLLIRSIQPNCTCITTELKDMRIKPGGQGTLVIAMQGTGRKGTQNKAVTIYSNDPVNPVQRISIQAMVD